MFSSGADILLAIDAPLMLKHDNGDTLTVEIGESVFLPAATKCYQATSTGRFVRAYNRFSHGSSATAGGTWRWMHHLTELRPAAPA